MAKKFKFTKPNIPTAVNLELFESGVIFEQVSAENEEDLKPSDYGEALTWATDWTTETIVLQLQRGIIFLKPKFQRRDAWTPPRKSRFIESLVIGLPIPQIVLAERKDKKGSFLVLDGKQRLLALQQFCDQSKNLQEPPLKLSGLTIKKGLNGKTYDDLLTDPALNEELNSFRSQTIRTIVIKNWPNEDFLYTVFLRLNTNSVPLSPQELRQALHPGPFMDFVDSATSVSKPIQNALGLTEPDFRMRDVEIVTRYYGFKNFAKTYRGNLKEFLDTTCKDLNKQWATRESSIREQFVELENAITISQKVFGADKAFRKFSEGRYETRLNRAVFDVLLYYFSQEPYASAAKAKGTEIKKAYENLCETDPEFLKALETSTKITDVVKKRFVSWGKVLSGILGLKFTSPF